MTENNGYKEAKKLFDERTSEAVKEATLETLEAIELKKEEKSRVEEELRVLKLDLDDLKYGKLEKVQERQNKSPVAKSVSRIVVTRIQRPSLPPPGALWEELMSGTYTTPGGKNIYL